MNPQTPHTREQSHFKLHVVLHICDSPLNIKHHGILQRIMPDNGSHPLYAKTHMTDKVFKVRSWVTYLQAFECSGQVSCRIPVLVSNGLGGSEL